MIMAADGITPAVISYIDHGVYPTDETIASSSLDPHTVSRLLHQLRQAQDEVKEDIRRLSRSAAPDVDTWISRAKLLQVDIQRSRNTARQIVAEAEAGRDLREKVKDASNKVALLQKEVIFNETLTGTLDHVRHANVILDQVLDAVVTEDLRTAVDKLEHVTPSIDALNQDGSSRVYHVLNKRAVLLRDNVVEIGTRKWEALIHVELERRRVTIDTAASSPNTSRQLGDVVDAAQRLEFSPALLQKLSKDLDRAIIRPRLMLDEAGQLARIVVRDNELSAATQHEDSTHSVLFRDLRTILDYLATRLVPSVSAPLSELLVPLLVTRLEEHWLDPSIPLDVVDMPEFQDLLQSVLALADEIDGFGWNGASQLRVWVQQAPKNWLTKRREAVLGDVRNLVFTGLRGTEVVEKIETQLVSRDDALAGGKVVPTVHEGEGDWDAAWDEPEEVQSEKPTSDRLEDDNDDEANAWDLDEDEVDEANPQEHGLEEDAWGWDDGNDDGHAPAPPSTAHANAHANKTQKGAQAMPSQDQTHQQQEITLRETFTTTLVPASLLSLLKSTIIDAQTLAEPQYATSVIAPTAMALYSLPTLALAIYRATAATAYTKLSTANILIYNDALHLASELQRWQAGQSAESRLRLDNDIKALESFAKRAYTAEMEAQRTILRDLVDGAQGFSNATTMPYKQECESAIDQTVDRLREVHQQWHGILSTSALLQSMGSLVATVTSKMILEIQELPDIGDADSKQLKLLCDKVSTIRGVFAQEHREGEEAIDMTFIYTPNWLKFQYLAEILESSLADIRYLWNEGELALEFTREEVVELIEALFADSELRRKAVGEIRRSGRGL